MKKRILIRMTAIFFALFLVAGMLPGLDKVQYAYAYGDGTYDFSGLGTAGSAGSGQTTLGDLFKVPDGSLNACVTLSAATGDNTAVYLPGASYPTAYIKAEGTSRCGSFTFKDIGISAYLGTRQFTSCKLVLKDYFGKVLSSETLAASGSIPTDHIVQLSSLYSRGEWNVAGVSQIELTYVVNGVDVSYIALENIKLGSITTKYANAETPVINTQPVGKTVNVGAAANLSVSASGGVSRTYQWYSNSTNSNSGGTLISGATSATISVPTASIGTTYYYCVVTNTDANAINTISDATSDTAAVEVNNLVNAAAPAISSEPQDVTVKTGITAGVSVSANVTSGALSYQWYSHTSDSNIGGTLIPGATSATYSSTPTVVGTIYYYCLVTNNDAAASGNKVASTTSQTGSITATPGDGTYDFSGLNTTAGSAGAGYSKLGVLFKVPDGMYTATPALSAATGEKTAVYLTVAGTSPSIIKAEGGSTCQSFTFKDLGISAFKEGDYFTSLSIVLKDNFGNPISSNNLGASGVISNTSIVQLSSLYARSEWNVIGVSSIELTYTLQSASNINLSLENIKIGNPAVSYPNAATPAIGLQPSGMTVNVGNTATLSVTASGTAALSYQWYSNNSNSNSGGNSISGADSTSYSAPTASIGTIYYYCVVTNTDANATTNKTASVASNAVAVTVNSLVNAMAPTISSQPQDTTVKTWLPASVSVSASVTSGALSYQWYSNTADSNGGGTLISGANAATYTSTPAVIGTVYYYCVITNNDAAATGNKVASTTSDVGAVIATPGDGTYDFRSLGTASSAGTGYAKLGDVFKVPNGKFTACAGAADPTGPNTAMFWASSTDTSATAVIKAEGSDVCKRFTFKDLGVSKYQNSDTFKTFQLVLKDENGNTINTYNLGPSGVIPTNSAIQLSSLYSRGEWNIADVSSIEITYSLNTAVAQLLSFENIKMADISAVALITPAPTISDIIDQSTDEDTTSAAIAFTVGDAETTAAALEVTVTSGDQALIPDSNIIKDGAGANRTITLTPAPNKNGSTLITVQVKDESDLVATVTFTFTVNSVNDIPTVSAITKTGNEDTQISFTKADFTANYSDAIENSPMTKIKITSLPGNGILKSGSSDATLNQEIDADSLANISFMPATDWSGTTSFTWQGYDGTDYSSDGAVTITVNPVNDSPSIAVNTGLLMTEDAAETTITEAMLKSTDPEETALTYSLTAIPSKGTLKNNGSVLDVTGTFTQAEIAAGKVTYTPNANANGSDSFGFTVSDGVGGTLSSQIFSISITAVNDAPSLTNITTLTGAEKNSAFNISYATLSAAADETDVDSATISFRIEAVSSGTLKKGGSAVVAGTTTLAPGESLSWTPATYGTGIEAFTVRAFDGSEASVNVIAVKVDVANEKAMVPTVDVTTGSVLKKGAMIELTSDSGAALYYTVAAGTIPDDPTSSSSQITSGNTITLDGACGQTVTVKAYAAITGKDNSGIAAFTYTIQAKQTLTISGLSANNKVYDGTTSAQISGTAALNGTITTGDAITVSHAAITAAFTNKSVGNAKAVTASGFYLTGADAQYYTLTQPTGLTANISAKEITVSAIAITEKNYDGTNAATIAAITISGVLAGDTVSADASAASAAFNNAGLGTGKTVNVGGTITLSGADANNYSLSAALPSVTGNILPAGTVLMPTASVAGGAVTSGSGVTLSCGTAGATIYFTIDGSTPTSASAVYTTSVAISGPMMIKAIALKEFMNDSGIMSEAYTIAVESSSHHNTYNTATTPPSNGTVTVNGETTTAGTSQNSIEGGNTVTTVTVDTVKLDTVLAQQGTGATITIPVTGGADVAAGVLTGQMLKAMENKAATLVVQTDSSTYTLPASEININSISEQLGTSVELKDIKVEIRIAEPSAATVKAVEDAASKGDFTIVVPAVDFSISCTYNDQNVDVSKFKAFVERTIEIPDGVDPSRITTGIVLNADGTFRQVPTKIIAVNGKYYAVINSLTNSTYTVVYNPVEFADVADHWAKAAVNDMGSRMIVSGIDSKNYDPDSDITRAQFAAIIVRTLGLQNGTGTTGFSDVRTSDWYAGAVKTAVEYGIISGYGNGTFGPNDKITREQAMAMISRAMKLTGLDAGLAAGEAATLLAAYTDGKTAADYAKTSIAECLKTGIVSGNGNGTLAPAAYITRAEVAVIAEKLLQKSNLI